jgi:tripartite-type tricarboxylate transporter receptor subunit TctC
MKRRTFAGATIALIAALGWAGPGWAEDYPSRPVTIIVPYPAAGAPDVMTRLIADQMRVRLSQNVLVENRPGAGGAIGTSMGARAPADGYTVTMLGSPNTLAMHTMLKPGFDLFADFAPVGAMNNLPNVLAINSKLPFKSVRDLVAYAKAHPGKLNYATSGPATPTDMGGRQFANVQGIDLTFVSYKGSTPAAQALVSGEADLSIINIGGVMTFLQSGALRALSIGTPVRFDMLPGVPGSSESGLGVAFEGWCGLGVPVGTPQSVVDKLNAALQFALQQDSVKQGAERAGAALLPGTPADLTALMRKDFEAVREMVAAAHVEKQ